MAKNKTLELIGDIDEKISDDCKGLSMDDDTDRAKMAWWIHQTFLTGDFRLNLKPKNKMSPGGGAGVEDSKNIRTGDKG